MSAFFLCFAAFAAMALSMDRHYADAFPATRHAPNHPDDDPAARASRRLQRLRRAGWLLLVLSLALATRTPAGIPASLGVTAWFIALSVAAVAVTATVTWQPRRTPELGSAALLAGLLAWGLGW